MTLVDLLDVVEEQGITGRTRLTALMDVLPNYYEWQNKYGQEKSLDMVSCYLFGQSERYKTMMGYEAEMKKEGSL